MGRSARTSGKHTEKSEVGHEEPATVGGQQQHGVITDGARALTREASTCCGVQICSAPTWLPVSTEKCLEWAPSNFFRFMLVLIIRMWGMCT